MEDVSQLEPARRPEDTHVYLVGGGIASLSAAVHLYYDAHVPANQIHIIEVSPVPGGSMGGAGEDWKRGYLVRAARKLNFSYHCLYDTLSKIPSTTDPKVTLRDEIESFNKNVEEKAQFKARLVATRPDGPQILDVTSIGLSTKERLDLLGIVIETEEKIGSGEIQAHFRPEFFETKFWDMWSSMYGFQPWHSAIEFRRYLHRFLHEFTNISTLAGIERTPMNDYQSVILPMETHLKDLGVDFQYDTKVLSVSFLPGDEISVSELQVESRGVKSTLDVKSSDVVLITLGSMTSSSRIGGDDRPPPPLPTQESILSDPDPVWKFWVSLADPQLNTHADTFGRPETFINRSSKSMWLSFTITAVDASFLDHLRKWSGTSNGVCPLITFRDCPWMMSVTIPNQPYFLDQPDNVFVLWGYGLYPDQEGTFVKKPMMQCTGQEILTELLHHLKFPLSPTLEKSTTIPCVMPFIGSPFLTREKGDRPDVIPKDSRNLGLLGQYVEIDRDVTFTMEYSVRAAQKAVYHFMGLKKDPPPVHRGDQSVQVLGEALMAIMN